MVTANRVKQRVKARNDTPVASRASCIRMTNEHNLGLLLIVSLTLVGVATASDLSASDADYLGEQLKMANDDDEMTRTLDREPSNEIGDETSSPDDSDQDSMYGESIKSEESSRVEVSEQPQSNWLAGNSSRWEINNRGLEERNVSVMNNQSSSIVFDVAKRKVDHMKESLIDEGGHKAKISSRDVKKNQAIESHKQTSLVDSDKEFDQLDYPIATPTREQDKSTRRNDPKQSSAANATSKNSSIISARKSTTPSPSKPTTSISTPNRSISDEINKRHKNTELKALESSTMESKIVVTNSPNANSEDSASDDDDQTASTDTGSKAEETQGSEESNASRSNETQSAPVRSSESLKAKTPKEAARDSLGQEPPARAPVDGRQLFVGPFKTESEAPDTITLAGVVYEKSGLSSPFQASSLTGIQPQVMGSSNIETSIVNGKFGHKFIQIPAGKSKLDLTPLIAASHQKYPMWPQLAANNQIYVPLPQAQLVHLLNKGQRQQVGGHVDQHRALKSNYPYNQSNVSLTLTSIPSSISLLAHLTDIISSLDTKQAASSPQASAAILSMGSDIRANPSTSSIHDDEWPSSTNSVKKEIDPYQSGLNSLLLGASSELKQPDAAAMTTVRHKDLKTNSPVLVVEKSVKPVKYHLLRAYLKLRHLLRPVDATFVFPSSNQLQPNEMNAILT